MNSVCACIRCIYEHIYMNTDIYVGVYIGINSILRCIRGMHIIMYVYAFKYVTKYLCISLRKRLLLTLGAHAQRGLQ